MLPWINFTSDLLKANQGVLDLPFRYFLVVTKSCQSKCQNCKIWKESPENELSLFEISKIAQNSPWVKWLNLTGGEPTDRDDLDLIVKAFHHYCPDLVMVNFTTNGLLPEKIEAITKAIAALKIPKFHVNVSIDGPSEIHDKLRGVPDNYLKAIDTYKRLAKIPGIEISAAMTLFPQNFKLIEETYLGIKKEIPNFLPHQMHLNLPHTSSHYYQNDKRNIDNSLEYIDQIKNFQAKYTSKINALSIIEKKYLKLAKKFIQTKKTPISCSALMSSVYISEKGEIYPCTIWDNPLGNLRDYDYDLLKLKKIKKYTQTMKMANELNCPQCWTPCEAYPSIMTKIVDVISYEN
jgi:MoaA/NifB/PqqE/SkfB family radical SAM enzyme